MRTVLLASVLLTGLVVPAQDGGESTLSGRVRDAEGKPLAGAVIQVTDLLAEQAFLSPHHDRRSVSAVRLTTRTDERGFFSIRGAYEVANHLTVRAFGYRPLDLKPVSIHDPLDLTMEPTAERVVDPRPVQVRPPAQPRIARAPAVAPKFRLEVVDSTGAPVGDLRAMVSWTGQGMGLGELSLLRSFDSRSIRGTEGVAELKGPVPGENQTGVVYVRAKGRGLVRRLTTWDPDNKAAVVSLGPAASVAGQLVDGKSREPVAGARVWAIPDPGWGQLEWDYYFYNEMFYRPGMQRLGAVVTDEKGRFRLPSLESGDWLLFADHPDRKSMLPRDVQLGRGEHKENMSLELPPALAIAGRITEVAPKEDWRVRLKVHRPGFWNSSEVGSDEGAIFVDADGSFHFEDIYPGTYEAQLLLLALPRQGPFMKIPIDIVEITATTERLDLDVSSVAPGRIRGRVRSDVPLGRLVVLAAPPPRGGGTVAWLQYDGPHCAVGLDGTYEIMAPGGERVIVVVDILTGAMLWRSPQPLEVRTNRTVEIDVDVPACRVDVSLELPEGTDSHLPYLLDICPDPSVWPKGIGRIGDRYDPRDSGMGFLLSGWETSWTLYLPYARTELRLWYADGRTQQVGEYLMRQEVRPVEGKTVRVVLEVPRNDRLD